MIVETGRRNIRHVGRECDVVDFLLVTQQTSNGLVGARWLPQVHGEVVTGRHQALDNLVVHGRGIFVAFLGGSNLLGVGRGDLAGVVMVGSAQSKVRRQSEVINAMGMRNESLDKRAILRVPDLDGLVVRRRIDLTSTTPLHTCHGSLVSSEHMLDALGRHVPHTHS